MAEMTIGRMAKLYGLHRSSLYEAVSKGRVTAGFNGKGQRVIDLSEMIRVYGEPPGQPEQTRQKPTPAAWARPTPNQTPDNDLMRELVELNRRQANQLEHMTARIESLEATMRALPSPAEAAPSHPPTDNDIPTPAKPPKSLAEVLARFEARNKT
ncbi:MAG: hypothetical protein L0J67_10640 [Halomonas sp.]|nr:hypothetical protein [Halomonas sp.]MDN6337079.1 hypothetical protein [Halomonas sp.]